MGNYKLTGMVLPFNEKSSITNNVYTKECIQTAFDNYAEQLKDNDINVDLSHKITSLNLKDEGIYADIELLDTEQGNNFKQLIDNDEKLTPAIKILGDVEESVNHYELINVKEIVSIDLIPQENCPFENVDLQLIKEE
jgi:hypothetical protein